MGLRMWQHGCLHASAPLPPRWRTLGWFEAEVWDRHVFGCMGECGQSAHLAIKINSKVYPAFFTMGSGFVDLHLGSLVGHGWVQTGKGA